VNLLYALGTRHSSGGGLPIGIWLAIAAFCILLVGISAWWSSKRRKERQAYCAARGYTYAPAGALPEQLSMFKVFDHGHSRRVGETIRGTFEGQPFELFDYIYVTGSGKNRTTHNHAIVKWQVGNDVPDFSLTPEGWLSRIGNVLGGQDIDFDDDREFSRAFQLKGTDGEAIRAAFTHERRRTLAANPGAHIAAGYGLLLTWQIGGLPRAQDLDATLAGAAAIRRLFT